MAADPAPKLAREVALEGYGCVIRRSHPRSIWRRDLEYPRQGLRIEVRPMTPDDERRELDFFKAQTVRERLFRFLGVTSAMPADLVRRLTHLDFNWNFAIVAVDRESDAIAGIARYARSHRDPTLADVAVAVLHKYSRLGLGLYLTAAVFDAARECGVRTLVAEILTRNYASRRLFEKVARQAGARRRFVGVDSDMVTYHFDLAGPPSPNGGVLRRPQPEGPDAAAEPGAFAVDHSRHPNSLWRHDLVFRTGLRVEVRPSDIDDTLRVAAFAQTVALSEGERMKQVTLQDLMDFTTGFTLIALDMATDDIVGVAHFHRRPDWSRMNVLTAPGYRGLGIADFLASEVLRAAHSQVVPRLPISPSPVRSAL